MRRPSWWRGGGGLEAPEVRLNKIRSDEGVEEVGIVAAVPVAMFCYHQQHTREGIFHVQRPFRLERQGGGVDPIYYSTPFVAPFVKLRLPRRASLFHQAQEAAPRAPLLDGSYDQLSQCVRVVPPGQPLRQIPLYTHNLHEKNGPCGHPGKDHLVRHRREASLDQFVGYLTEGEKGSEGWRKGG